MRPADSTSTEKMFARNSLRFDASMDAATNPVSCPDDENTGRTAT